MPVWTVALVWELAARSAVLEAGPGQFASGVDAAPPVRAAVAFVLVLAVGGVLLARREAFVDRAIDATLARPLASLGYGAAALAVVGFAGVYLASQLALVSVGGLNVGGVGLLFGALALLVTAALGFTVVGGVLVLVWGGRNDWSGLALGAALAAALSLLDPVLAGAGAAVVVAAGIGGAARTWLHASYGPTD